MIFISSSKVVDSGAHGRSISPKRRKLSQRMQRYRRGIGHGALVSKMTRMSSEIEECTSFLC